METIIGVFNVISDILNKIITGFIEFINTIPLIFNEITYWSGQLFPEEFATYLIALIPIIISLLIIKFVKG